MLLILRSNKLITIYRGSWTKRVNGNILAFHHGITGKAITLPNFEPTTLDHANRIMHELETTGSYTGR
jgi:hypothetical protein